MTAPHEPGTTPGGMRRIVIFDTNVLLSDPNALLSFPKAEVVIPETVLGELDKLKTARVDPDLRFRGREVSRLLFELSEDGSLTEGVDLPDGGCLRVATLEGELPDGMSTRQADDKILATAYQVRANAPEDVEVLLVTNDLNMLLKAQTLGIAVMRHAEGVDGSFARRFIIRPFQRYKVPIGILAVAVAVFLAIIVVAMYTQGNGGVSADLPAEFKTLLTADQVAAYDSIQTLQRNPSDPEALLALANLYFNLGEQAYANNRSMVFQYAAPGIRYYQRYLKTSPNDSDARADLASLMFYSGKTDQAIQEVGLVLRRDPNHVNANFNLGIFLWQGRRDTRAAEKQILKVIALTKGDSQQHAAYQRAELVLQQIQAELKSAGQSTEATGVTQ